VLCLTCFALPADADALMEGEWRIRELYQVNSEGVMGYSDDYIFMGGEQTVRSSLKKGDIVYVATGYTFKGIDWGCCWSMEPDMENGWSNESGVVYYGWVDMNYLTPASEATGTDASSTQVTEDILYQKYVSECKKSTYYDETVQYETVGDNLVAFITAEDTDKNTTNTYAVSVKGTLLLSSVRMGGMSYAMELQQFSCSGQNFVALLITPYSDGNIRSYLTIVQCKADGTLKLTDVQALLVNNTYYSYDDWVGPTKIQLSDVINISGDTISITVNDYENGIFQTGSSLYDSGKGTFATPTFSDVGNAVEESQQTEVVTQEVVVTTAVAATEATKATEKKATTTAAKETTAKKEVATTAATTIATAAAEVTDPVATTTAGRTVVTTTRRQTSPPISIQNNNTLPNSTTRYHDASSPLLKFLVGGIVILVAGSSVLAIVLMQSRRKWKTTTAMIFCPHCGTKQAANVTFCKHCGRKIR
jgi:hypothetical protein